METIINGEIIMDSAHLRRWLQEILKFIVVVIDLQTHLVVVRLLFDMKIIVTHKMITCGDEQVIR